MNVGADRIRDYIRHLKIADAIRSYPNILVRGDL